MAKSMRSKVKRSYRHKKREEGIYAATEAARLERLNAKLQSVITTPKVDLVDAEEDDDEDETMRAEDQPQDVTAETSDAMDVELDKSKRISTHGPRGSRREEWRKSKGLEPRPKRNGMNRQGLPAARRRSGRSHRRR